MSDRYAQLVNAPGLAKLAGGLGLPRPVELERHREGTPVLSGAVLTGAAPGARLERALKATLDRIGVERAGAEGRAKALIFDASGISDSTELVELQRFFYPGVGRLQRNGRVVVLGVPPAEAGSTRAATAQRALEGFTRSLGKEVGGRGATAQLVRVSAGGEEQLESTLRFLLSPKSAYVSGQVIEVGKGVAPLPELDWERPLAGRTALVTGASRGIGRTIAMRLASQGAVVCAAARGDNVRETAAAIAAAGGRAEAYALDVTDGTAVGAFFEAVIAQHGRVDVLVNNAGITRDQLMLTMRPARWRTMAFNTPWTHVKAPVRLVSRTASQSCRFIRSIS